MAHGDEPAYTHAHELHDDGSVTFACATDAAAWPWLALDPHDPIVVQTLCYYGSYEVAVFRGHYESGQWSALTFTDWHCGAPGVGHAVRGISHAPTGEEGRHFQLSFYDAEDRLVSEMGGTGVVFRNRDFESWRSAQKRDLGPPADLARFPFVDARDVGMRSPVECYVSALDTGQGIAAMALVTRENGFPPQHPYHDGSGDHVNASHLADAARQFLRLLKGGAAAAVTGGEMRFSSYVELGHPFQLELMAVDAANASYDIAIRQAGRDCAAIRLLISVAE